MKVKNPNSGLSVELHFFKRISCRNRPYIDINNTFNTRIQSLILWKNNLIKEVGS